MPGEVPSERPAKSALARKSLVRKGRILNRRRVPHVKSVSLSASRDLFPSNPGQPAKPQQDQKCVSDQEASAKTERRHIVSCSESARVDSLTRGLCSIWGGNQAVAHTTDGGEIARIAGIIFDLFAQPAHMYIYGAAVTGIFPPPHLPQYRIS